MTLLIMSDLAIAHFIASLLERLKQQVAEGEILVGCSTALISECVIELFEREGINAMRHDMKVGVISAIIGAVAMGMVEFALNRIENDEISREAVERLSDYFDVVDTDMSYEKALQAVYEEVQILKDENKSLSNQVEEQTVLADDLNSRISEISAEIENVQYKTPSLVISGESIDTPLRDFVAVIEGKNYYLETFLNSFILDEKISMKDGTLSYMDSMPEKVKAVTGAVIHDNDRFEVQEASSDYIMGTEPCTYGLVNMQWGSGYSGIYVECGGEYSQLVFNLGHINDSGSGEKTINILYLDPEGEYQLAYTRELSQDMGYLEGVSVDIFNTQTVKIEYEGPYGSVRYGMSNIYLVK